MTRYTVLLDANVFYPAPLRDLLLELAAMDVFRGRWTEAIHDEWLAALRAKRPDLDPDALDRTRRKINQATRDCLVEDYEALIPALSLPDPDDRHVLAAAIVGRCDAIITCNTKDFPEDVLAVYGIEAQHPDDFLANMANLVPGSVCEGARRVRQRLNNPPYSAEEYLSTLRRQGLVATVAELEQFSALI